MIEHEFVRTNRKKNILFIFLVIIVSIYALSMIYDYWHQYRRPFRCSDFRTQEEAQMAFMGGAHNLDKENDKIACENLPKKSHIYL